MLSHNRLDLASLAILTGLACELVDGGPDAAGAHGHWPAREVQRRVTRLERRLAGSALHNV